jgi:hypothetical protein
MISARELHMHSVDMQEGDLVCQAWASVSLGFKLLQLLAHAAVGAARSGAECNWSNKYRFFSEEYPGTEIRMLEACTFGGVLRREREQERVAKSHYTINGAEGVPGLWFALSDFPGEHLLAISGTEPDDYPGDLNPIGSYGPHYHREWQVSFSWLLRLMTDTFWDNDARTRGQKALIPPKEVGYVMHRDGRRKYGPLHAEVIRRGIVPHGYRMLPRSHVMVHKSLRHDSIVQIMFGAFNIGRMDAIESDDEMYRDDDSRSGEDDPESDGSVMDEGTFDIEMGSD